MLEKVQNKDQCPRLCLLTLPRHSQKQYSHPFPTSHHQQVVALFGPVLPSFAPSTPRNFLNSQTTIKK